MCHDRDRLIGYLYDECEAGERQQIDDHLAGCPACRAELAGLRAVRQDLLAWDVPSHASVWRPVAPPRIAWRAVPAWAMAAAAGLMIVSGAAGGAIAQMLLTRPEPAPVQAAVQPVAAPVFSPAPVVAAVDVADLERRLSRQIRAELQADMDTRLRQTVSQQRDLITRLYNELVGVSRELQGMEGKVESVMALTEQPRPMPASFSGQ